MREINYAERQILRCVRRRPQKFAEILRRIVAEGTIGTRPLSGLRSGAVDRAVDRALQSLRRRGLITYANDPGGSRSWVYSGPRP